MVSLIFGCRSSKPFGRFVQVTQEPQSELTDVEPPRQRLATAKPRMESDVTVTTHTEDPEPSDRYLAQTKTVAQRSASSAKADSVAATRSTDSQTDAPPTRQSSPVRDEARRSLTRRAPSRTDAAKNQSLVEKTKPSTTSEATQNAGDRIAQMTLPPKAMTQATSDSVDQSTPAPIEHTELLAAFSDYPPEVQREALRRLVAATARSAEQTSQPMSLNRALAENLDDLPELPTASETRPEQTPTRLASSQQRESTRRSEVPAKQADSAIAKSPIATSPIATSPIAVAAPAKDSTNTITAAASHSVASATRSQSQPITDELVEVTIQTAADAANGKESVVKTVSVDREIDESTMVTRASVSASANDDASGISTANIKGMLAPEPSVLDEKSLYATLVKRLSQAPAGESDSERASRLIKLRHLMVLSGDLDAAVEQIEGMSESEQEFIRHQLLGLWTMVDPDGHPVASRRITTALPQLREAAKFAAAATDSLEVRALSFCTEIESYGQIKPFKGNRFGAGQQVILYCEIENFSVNKNADGYETHLQGSYDVYNASNEKVVSQLLPADKQVSANYLRDYFIAYQMHLPAQLAAGTYRLQLTMEDVNGKKYGQASIPFEIAK